MEHHESYLYLPEEYWKRHDQCESIIRQIEEFITDEDYKELRIQKFDLGTGYEIDEDENILDFLLRINKVHEHDKIIKTTIVYGLIIDVCYFLQEAISCSKKYRLSVTFSLLRKPFI